MEQTIETPKRILLDALLTASGYRQKRQFLRLDLIRELEIREICPCPYLLYDLDLKKAIQYLVAGGGWAEEVARKRLLKADAEERQRYDPNQRQAA